LSHLQAGFVTVSVVVLALCALIGLLITRR
jgi:hypothetical protein